MKISSVVEIYVLNELLVGSHGTEIDHDQSLISSGIIDSLAILRLITFLEEEFGVVVEDVEVIPENFETINIITEFVENKKVKS